VTERNLAVRDEGTTRGRTVGVGSVNSRAV